MSCTLFATINPWNVVSFPYLSPRILLNPSWE